MYVDFVLCEIKRFQQLKQIDFVYDLQRKVLNELDFSLAK